MDSGIHPSRLTLVRGGIDWPGVQAAVSPYLRLAMQEGADRDWSFDQVLEMLRDGRWALYGVVRDGTLIGAGATTVTAYGKRRVLEIILFGADINSEDWVETLNSLKEQAKLMGCSAVVGRGRPGWARYLRATPIHAFEIEV